jgi:hypothetical protein
MQSKPGLDSGLFELAGSHLRRPLIILPSKSHICRLDYSVNRYLATMNTFPP